LQLYRAVSTLQQANIQQAAAALLDRTEARASKLPSAKFPATVHSLKRVSGATTERELPTIWHKMANCSKSEIRLVLDAAFKGRARELTAATPTPPVITKEILECYTQQKLASQNPDYLEDGLQLFHFTPGSESHTRDTRIRTNLFDLVSAGDAAPSISDMQALSSAKVTIPTSHFELTTALQRHSLALDVYLGPQHLLCSYYRNWIRESWLRLEPSVRQFNQQFFSAHHATAYGQFARWISLRMNDYFVRLTDSGINATLPTLDRFGEMISNRENFFPPIPERYLEPPFPTSDKGKLFMYCDAVAAAGEPAVPTS
jgi:hypothetical protein